MSGRTEPGSPFPDVSAIKLVLSFSVGMLIGVALVFSILRANLQVSLAPVLSFGSQETILLLAVLALFMTFLGLLALFDL